MNIKDTQFFIKERENEQIEILNYINLFIKKENKNNIIHIYGTPGSGKTLTIKKTLNFYNKILINKNIEYIYLNAIKKSIFKTLKNIEKRKIIVIDEIDMINKKNFYKLFDEIYESKGILLFIISNTFILSLIKENKLISRIGDIFIKFEPYKFNDLETKCNNKYIARYLSTYGDMRKVNEINKLIPKERLTPLESVQLIKNTFIQLINIVEVSLLERNILIFIYSLKNYKKNLDFVDFQSFCKLRNWQLIDTFNYENIINNLINKGFLNKKLELYYLKEELKNILNEE